MSQVPAESPWWPKFFLFSAILSLLILASGPFAYKYGAMELAPSLISILVALVGAVLVFVGGFVMAVVASRRGMLAERNVILCAMILSIVPMLFVLPQMIKARSVPPIHDISTDTANPPEFVEVVKLRATALNDLNYAHGDMTAEETADLQQQAYPAVTTVMTDLAPPEAIAKAAVLLAEQGLDIVSANPEQGIVEATATTFWFGFKDDVVVRAMASGEGTKLDVRSVSRVGQSDIGANAARIEKFLAAFTST